ncbi:MAG TPA: hypothetical protein PLJ27_16530, partial [Polyangiaceae bacterium]|nr:hypothetical protein [Polyangiaceae bacterium]
GTCGQLAAAGPARLSGIAQQVVTIKVPLSGTGETDLPTELSFKVQSFDIKKKSVKIDPKWTPSWGAEITNATLTTTYDNQDTWAYFSGKIDVSATRNGCSYELSVPIDFTHVDMSCSTASDCNNPITDLCEGGACVKPECIGEPMLWGQFYTSCYGGTSYENHLCRTLGNVGGVCADEWCISYELVNGSCSIGRICDGGTCVPPGGALVGASCTRTLSDSGCEAGALCDQGICRWACLEGEPGPHCPAGEVCLSTVCKAASDFAALGAPCSNSGDPCAPSGENLVGICRAGICKLRCAKNADCAANEICDTYEKICTPTKCGDGVVDPNAPYEEKCDDHNQTDGDGCNRYCKKEAAQNSDCTDAATVIEGTQSIALTPGPLTMNCSSSGGTNDYGATIRFVAPAAGTGDIRFTHQGSSSTDYPQLADLVGCPGTIRYCSGTVGSSGTSTWSGKSFTAYSPNQELWFAVRGRKPTGTVKVTFKPYSCVGIPLPVGDTVMTGPSDSNIFLKPSFNLCEAPYHNRRLATFTAEKDGTVVLTLKTVGASLRAFEGQCPSQSQQDLACMSYSASQTNPASVSFPVTAGKQYGVITGAGSSAPMDITVHRAGP